MNQLSRDGVALAYEEAGSGAPPLVFVHGAYCDHTDFAPQIEHFRRDHRVVAVDLRGHGESDKPEQEYTVAGFADDLAWLCRELGIHKPVVAGHSLGGMVALELAARFPDLPAAIVALDASILVPDSSFPLLEQVNRAIRTPGYRDAILGFMSMAFLPVDDPQRKERILDGMSRVAEHVMTSTWEHGLARWDSAAAAEACGVPVLYVDHGAPNCDIARFRQLCPQLVTGQTVGSGHWAMLEVPQQVDAMIERFIAHAGTLAEVSKQRAAMAQAAGV